MFSVFCMEKIFTFRTRFVPCLVEGEKLVCNRYFADAVFCFALNDLKILFFQMHMLFLEIQEFRDSCPVVKKHENNLVVFIFLQSPELGKLLFGKLVAVKFIGILVFVTCYVYKGSVILIANVMHQCKTAGFCSQTVIWTD